MIRAGRLIVESSLEETKDERDDNWLMFKFGAPDPAISPFKMPQEANQSTRERRTK